MVGMLLSYWRGLFSGAMLVSGVYVLSTKIIPKICDVIDPGKGKCQQFPAPPWKAGLMQGWQDVQENTPFCCVCNKNLLQQKTVVFA